MSAGATTDGGVAAGGHAPVGQRVGVVADDLIWGSRLTAAVERSGATPVRLGTRRALDTALEATSLAETGEAGATLLGVVVDLNGRGYDGVDAVRAVAEARLPVIAVGQHEDLALRKRALDAGAVRVFSYNKAFTDGPTLVASWLLRARTPVEAAR